MKKYQLIDYLKGYAILTIVLYHLLNSLNYPGLFTKAVQFGGTGVHAFILISGFGLYFSYLRKPLPYPDFQKRRLTKVYIPYIIIVLISALITQFIPLFKSSWYALAGHVFLYKMFDNEIIGSYGGHFWFISTIIQFYLIFHLLTWLKKNTSDIFFMIIGVFISIGWGIIVAVLHRSELRSWNSFFLQYIWEFMLGMVIAGMVVKEQETIKEMKLKSGDAVSRIAIPAKRMFKIRNWQYAVLAAICLPIYAFLALKAGSTGRIFNDIPALIGYMAIAIFIYNLKIKPLNNFILHTNSISYSFFLIHILTNNFVIYLWKKLSFDVDLLTILISFIISFLLAHIYNLLINQIYKSAKI